MTKLFKTPPKTGPAHVAAEAKQTLSKHARQVMGKYVAREKLPGEVQAPENDLWQRPVYRTGDGDFGNHVPRLGSLRAFTLPSRGIAT